jgi:hypothetical protein
VKLWNIPALVPASALSTLETWSAVRPSTCSRSRPSKSKLMRVAGASIPHRAQDAAELVGYRALRHTGALFDDRGLESFG